MASQRLTAAARGREGRIAVLITYYNEGALLRECIESVARQPEAPDEILVYDDASTDRPEAYLPEDVTVTVVRGVHNAGPGHGRNALLAATQCDYVHFHDADDLFAPQWAASVRAALATPGVDVVLTELQSVREGAVVSPAVMRLDRLEARRDLVRFCIGGALLLPSSTARRSLVTGIGGFRTREVLHQSEDFDFHVRLAAAVGDRFALLYEPLVIQRLRTGSHSSDLVSVWASAAESVRLLSGELPPEYRQDLSDAAARFASQLFRLGARREARGANQLARELGRPSFSDQSMGYSLIAATVGQEAAEGLAGVYRKAVPHSLRRLLRR